jgi:hypothetical protein
VRRRTWRAAGPALAAGVFLWSAAGSGLDFSDLEPASSGTAAVVCPAIDPVRAPVDAGLRVFLDRRTGRIRPPTLEEVRALGEAAAKGRRVEYLEPIEVFARPDGSWSVDLKGAFEAQVVVRRRPDGTFETRCLTGGGAATEAK